MRQSNDKPQPGSDAEGEQPDENKEAQPADADAEKADGEADGDEEKPKSVIIYGQRFIAEQFIHYDFVFLCEDVKKVVPEPEWPDPDNEPLPPPLINSIQRKPPQRAQRMPITKFSIWTPIPED